MIEAYYGTILGKIRRRKNIKAETIAHHLGISPSTYSRIETGRISASFATVTEICAELGLTLAQFHEILKRYQNNKVEALSNDEQ